MIEIRNGTVIDATGRPPLEGATVRISGDKIVAVGRDLAPAHDSGGTVRVLDATGHTVMPGLIDAHCHITYGEGRSFEEIDFYAGPEYSALRSAWNAHKVILAGVTSMCDPTSTWNVAAAVRDAINAEMFPGPRIFAAGQALCPIGGFSDFYPSWIDAPRSGVAVLYETKDQLVNLVRDQVKNRVDMIKIIGDVAFQERRFTMTNAMTSEEMALVVNEAHRLARIVMIHARYGPTVRAAAEAGVDCIFHASYVTPDDLALVAEANVPICPTLTFTANIVQWGRELGMSERMVDTKKRELDSLAQMIKLSKIAGVRLMAGSESGMVLTPYGEWHARELELLVELGGLSPMEAIIAATRNNAFAVGLEGEVGTLEEGRLADVLVVDGDPLSDLSVLGKREKLVAVIKAGRLVNLETYPAPRRIWSHERGFPVSNQLLHPADVPQSVEEVN